jgi:hypothetical protein
LSQAPAIAVEAFLNYADYVGIVSAGAGRQFWENYGRSFSKIDGRHI